jgi:hypothetical protein
MGSLVSSILAELFLQNLKEEYCPRNDNKKRHNTHTLTTSLSYIMGETQPLKTPSKPTKRVVKSRTNCNRKATTQHVFET